MCVYLCVWYVFVCLFVCVCSYVCVCVPVSMHTGDIGHLEIRAQLSGVYCGIQGLNTLGSADLSCDDFYTLSHLMSPCPPSLWGFVQKTVSVFFPLKSAALGLCSFQGPFLGLYLRYVYFCLLRIKNWWLILLSYYSYYLQYNCHDLNGYFVLIFN